MELRRIRKKAANTNSGWNLEGDVIEVMAHTRILVYHIIIFQIMQPRMSIASRTIVPYDDYDVPIQNIISNPTQRSLERQFLS